MSKEGGLSSKEYGGAHEKHANGLDVNNIGVSDSVIGKTQIFCQKNNADHILSFQDGDIEIIDKDVDTDSENLQFLAGQELDSFRTDAQNNSEWLKRNVENVNFDIPSSSSDDTDLFDTSVGELCNDVNGSQMFISPLSHSIFTCSTADTSLVTASSSNHQTTISSSVSETANCNVQHTASTVLKDVVNIDSLSQIPSVAASTETPLITIEAISHETNNQNISSSDQKVDQPVLLSPVNVNRPQFMQATAIPQTIQVLPTQPTVSQDGNLKFATISIQNDKPSNSTHILVNTNQGNQLYKINTADLKQATNTLPQLTEAQPVPISQTGYLLLNPEQATNGVVNIIQMDGTQKVVRMDGSPPKVFMNSLENKKVFICPVEGCEKMFRRLSKYKTHQMRHTGERPFKCSKPGCEWAFTTHYKLKRHEESHQGKKAYLCPISGCGGKFTTVYNLNSHIKLHDRPCTEVCPLEDCGQKFVTKRQLDAHMKTHSGHEKTYKCPHEGCDKVFTSRLSMGSHPRVHLHNKEDLTCKFEGCGKVFDKTCRLNQHMRSHTGEKPYICTFEGCDWAFTTASKLKRHQGKHTGVRKWVCDLCGKAFMRSEHLKGHKITHSGDKPFACPVEGCDVKFTAKSSLFVHIKKHENGGKKVMYHCPMEGCLKKYSNKPSLRAHIVKHVKQVMADNNNAQVDTANLDIMPYLDNDLPDIGLLASIDGPNPAVSEGQPVTSTECSQNPSVTEASSGPAIIDPSEFIASSGVSETSFITTESGEVQQISPEVINQILSSMERQDQMANAIESDIIRSRENLLVSPINTKLPKDKASSSSCKLGGSARTDYHANQLMSERAKKRRSKETSTNVNENSTQELTEKNNYMVNSFNPGDGMTSRGITFRDPETGVLYLQTQLLQDDPPNMDMYCEDEEFSADLPVTSCTSLNDTETIPEFTGSTINLKDLH